MFTRKSVDPSRQPLLPDMPYYGHAPHLIHSLTLHSVLGSKSCDTSESADHEILEHLVARLAAIVSVALEGWDVGRVRLVARAAVEW